MVTTTHFALTFIAVVVGLTLIAATGAAGYAAPVAPSPAIQYVYFDPATPASPTASGWVGSGKYSLPPDVGGVTVESTAFGSIMADSSGLPIQTFVVRLGLGNAGTQRLTVDPGAVRLIDKSGRLRVGARAFSGNSRIAMESLNPGGRDTLQLEFPLPAHTDLASLGHTDVDLPYLYGAGAYVTHLDFTPAEERVPYAPQVAYQTAPVPSSTSNNNDYAPPSTYDPTYDTSSYPWMGSGWWWGGSPWWSTPVFGDDLFFRRHFDGDGDADDFGRRFNRGRDADDFALRNSAVNPALTGNLRGAAAAVTPRVKDAAITGPAARGKGEGTGERRIAPPSNLGRTGTTTFTAPRTTPHEGFVPLGGGTPHLQGATPLAPRSFTPSVAPHSSVTFSPPHSGGASFSAPHSSGASFGAPRGGGGGGGGSHGGGHR
jgi:hypothetical protein